MIALDPAATLSVVLDSDAGKTKPPTWTVRHPTARKMLRIRSLLNQIGEDDERSLDVLLEAVGLLVVSGQNLPDDYDLQKLPDWLTLTELGELLSKSIAATQIGADDAKKSGSPSPSDGAASVPSAEANA